MAVLTTHHPSGENHTGSLAFHEHPEDTSLPLPAWMVAMKRPSQCQDFCQCQRWWGRLYPGTVWGSTKALRSLLDEEVSLGAQRRVETFTLVQSNQEFPQHTKAKPETRTSAFSGQNKVNSFFSCWRGVRKKANYNRILRSRVSHANIPQVQRQWKITIWISNTDVFGY